MIVSAIDHYQGFQQSSQSTAVRCFAELDFGGPCALLEQKKWAPDAT